MKKLFMIIGTLLVFSLLINTALAIPEYILERRNKTEPLPYDPEAQKKAVEEGEPTTTTTRPKGFKMPEFPKLDPDTVIIIGFVTFVVAIILIIGLIKRRSRSSAEFMMQEKF